MNLTIEEALIQYDIIMKLYEEFMSPDESNNMDINLRLQLDEEFNYIEDELERIKNQENNKIPYDIIIDLIDNNNNSNQSSYNEIINMLDNYIF